MALVSFFAQAGQKSGQTSVNVSFADRERPYFLSAATKVPTFLSGIMKNSHVPFVAVFLVQGAVGSTVFAYALSGWVFP